MHQRAYFLTKLECSEYVAFASSLGPEKFLGLSRNGRLISCESWVRREENKLDLVCGKQYREEALLRKVGDSNVVRGYKVNKAEMTRRMNGRRKKMHGQYVRQKESIVLGRTWQCIAEEDLKGCTEVLIYSAQEQALRTNYMRFYIDHAAEEREKRWPMWWVRAVSCERQYKGSHDNVARYIHWQLCGKYGLERADSWYEQKPEGVVESENFWLLWDSAVQCDRKIEARKLDIVFIDKKEREVVMLLTLSQVMRRWKIRNLRS